MDYNKRALEVHEQHHGKIEVTSKLRVETKDDLSVAYTPGVAEPCRQIAKNPEDVYRYTAKGNLVAVVSDGTAVLGLGDIGPEAAMPVMEGKSILFKTFANIDAFPICLDTKDVDEIVETVVRIAPTFGGINLEDISAPRCFEIEAKLKERLNIPVFHDDQHGTAIVVAAGIVNALKVVGKSIGNVRVVINGAGSAGIAIAKMLLNLDFKHIVLVDRKGALAEGESWMNEAQQEMAHLTNPEHEKGSLKEVLTGKDIFIGVSAPDLLKADDIQTMAKDAIVFAMANPTPEIMPDEAEKGHARIVATGRSDFPNQINNVLVFPGIFRGALDARAHTINDAMKVAAVYAIADVIDETDLHETYIIPSAFDPNVVKTVAHAVAKAARESGVAGIQ